LILRTEPALSLAHWRRAGLLPAFERLDDDHMSTTAWAWRAMVDRFNRVGIVWRWRDVEQLAGEREAGLAGADAASRP
jgi:hypothetical protein